MCACEPSLLKKRYTSKNVQSYYILQNCYRLYIWYLIHFMVLLSKFLLSKPSYFYLGRNKWKQMKDLFHWWNMVQRKEINMLFMKEICMCLLYRFPRLYYLSTYLKAARTKFISSALSILIRFPPEAWHRLSAWGWPLLWSFSKKHTSPYFLDKAALENINIFMLRTFQGRIKGIEWCINPQPLL